MKVILFSLITALTIYACNINYVVTYSGDIISESKDVNACRQLKDSAIVYAIFIDAKNFHPWTEFAINSTMDSIKKANKWMEEQAQKAGKKISIKTIHHMDGTKMSFSEKRTGTYYSLNQNFSFSKTRNTKRKFVSHLNHWTDKMAKYVGKGVRPNSNKTGTRLKVKTIETLILALQDKYKTDNVSVMFFVNGFYQKLPSVTYHAAFNGFKPEYSIVTCKNPATIAHEFLHLYGAVDLYPNSNFPNFNYEEIEEIYPNEIMRSTHKSINKLMLSPISKYYIGWQNSLDKANTRLLYHKARVLDY